MYQKKPLTPAFFLFSRETVGTPATLTGSSLKWRWNSLPPTSCLSWIWTRTSSLASPSPTRNMSHPLRVKQAHVLKTAGHVSLSACMCVTCMLRVVKAHSYYCNRIYQRAQVDHHISKGTKLSESRECNRFPLPGWISLRDCVCRWCLYNGKRSLCNKLGTNTTNPKWAIWRTTMPPSIIYLQFIIFPCFGLYLSELYTELMFNSLASTHYTKILLSPTLDLSRGCHVLIGESGQKSISLWRHSGRGNKRGRKMSRWSQRKNVIIIHNAMFPEGFISLDFGRAGIC